jgi:hypothetical protein
MRFCLAILMLFSARLAFAANPECEGALKAWPPQDWKTYLAQNPQPNGVEWALFRKIAPKPLPGRPDFEGRAQKQLENTVTPEFQLGEIKNLKRARWLATSIMPGQVYGFFERIRYETGNVMVEIYDTSRKTTVPISIRRRLRAKGIEIEDWIKNPHRWEHGNPLPVYKAEDDAMALGKRIQNEAMHEILGFVFPLYAERRHWNEDFIKKLHAKAFATMDFTRYIVVREKLEGGKPGKILATLGLTRSLYRKFQFFNLKTQKWEERTFGTMRPQEQHRWRGTQEAPAFLGTDFVRALPMEDYFGEDYELPRPATLEGNFDADYTPGLRRYMRKIGGDEANKGSVMFGAIYEPTKFALAKDLDLRGEAYAQVLVELFRSIFMSGRSDDFNVNGQHLYTYNDKTGALMYGRMGFEVMGPQWSRKRDGVEWTALSMSPKDLVKKLSDPNFMRGRAIQDFAEYFQRAMAHIEELNL